MSSPASPAQAALFPAQKTTSIAQVAGMISNAIGVLKQQGNFIVHCQWIRPQPKTGSTGFFTVSLSDTVRTDISIQGIAWDAPIIQQLLEDGQKFGMDLADRNARCEVMLEVSIDCWYKKAAVYLKIHRLNVVGMKGLKHLEREAAIQRLTELGLLRRQTTIPWITPALRIALVTKPGSAACEDVLSILRHSGYAFCPILIPVTVQGVQAESTLIAAFRQIESRRDDFDVVLLVRGGGSELDLMAYDRFGVAEAVAQCSLPVLTGLGHQIDRAVCDEVAYRAFETPTASAQYLAKEVKVFHEAVKAITASIQTTCERRVSDARTRILRLTTPICHGALTPLHRARQRAQAIQAQIIHDRIRQRINAARHQLNHLRHTTQGEVMARLMSGQVQIQTILRTIQFGTLTTLQRLRMRVETALAHIQAVNPDRLLRLGFCYVTGPDGTVLKQPETLSPNDSIQIHLRHHLIDATVTKIKEHTHDTRRIDSEHPADTSILPRKRVQRTRRNQSSRPQ